MDEMHSCLCCLQYPPDKDLTTPYTYHDRTDIYTDMLKDCFNIRMELDEWGSCGICSLCAGRLRDASDFKLQVQRCQAELRARSQPKTSVKGEESAAELPAEDDEKTGYEHVLYELFRSGVAAGEGASDVEESVLQESPVKQEPATEDETELLDSERAVKSEVPDGSDGPAREYCEKEYIMQSPVLLRAESPVSLRARSQLAAACAVSRSSLYKHLKHQTQMSSTDHKPYHCSKCKYQTSDKSNLKRHQRIHTGEKLLKCGYCDFKCSQNSDLHRHQRIHTGEKPFQCSYCDYACNWKPDLRRHQRKHTGEKPFKCGYCDYNSGNKSNLQRHMKIHTGWKPFKGG